MWTRQDVESALALGTETRSVEVKSGCLLTDKGPIGKIVRAVLAMSNIIDGGRVIVGIDNTSVAAMTPGLTPDQVAAWQQDESIYDIVAKYADPPVSFTFKEHVLSNRVTVIVLDVAGIAGEPHFCRKNLHDSANKLVLREGALYVRSITKPESVEVEDRAAMQDIIDSATTHRLRAFVEQATAAGVELSVGTPGRGDIDYFEQQRKEAFE